MKRRNKGDFWFWFWVAVAILAALLFVLRANEADAHEWYDQDCCSGQDCFPLFDGDVEATQSGYTFTYEDRLYLVPYNSNRIRQSKDGHYHVCIPGNKQVRCFYKPDMGV